MGIKVAQQSTDENMSEALSTFMASEAHASSCAFINHYHKGRMHMSPETLEDIRHSIREHFICIEDLFESGLLTDVRMKTKLRKSVVFSAFNSNDENK